MPSRRQVIADDIRNQIATGQLKAGERLPSEASLASRYQVSTPTLRSALMLLQGEGLVEKIHGKGNFVRHESRRITYLGGGRTSHENSAVDQALHVSVRITHLQAQGHLIALLEVPANSRLTQYLCVRSEGESPHSLARIYVPCDLPQTGPLCELPPSAGFEATLMDLYPALAELRECVTARPPTPEEAQILRISPNLAVLAITRVAVDSKGRVVEAALLVFPSHRADAYFITRPVTVEKRREG
ncbi:GntR family transcriptional regulator [Streptomyces sp. NPDC056721]|uniref:GntR family transcriptional regulator n=1 Tax=Streptomyces sp. NPDC056721 TaxID=3345923 RepID=UPI0036C3B721